MAITVEEFRQLLSTKTESEIVQELIVTPDPGPYLIADALVHIEAVVRHAFQIPGEHRITAYVVGSAKLGFSYIEKRRGDEIVKPAYRSYEPGRSDVDIAIVSPMVYGKIWNELASTGSRAERFPNSSKLGDYMYHGWLRPDHFPSPPPQRCQDWETAARRARRHPELKYKRLRFALFHSQYFLELYQQRGVRMAKEQEAI